MKTINEIPFKTTEQFEDIKEKIEREMHKLPINTPLNIADRIAFFCKNFEDAQEMLRQIQFKTDVILYTKAQASKIFEIHHDSLNRWIKNNKIATYIIPNKKTPLVSLDQMRFQALPSFAYKERYKEEFSFLNSTSFL